jgi:hypothetical protein
MKMNKIQQQALKAKEQGYEYISSVVKQYRATIYYHVNSVDSIIANGKWRPAPKNYYGWHGRIGRTWKNVPEKTISKQDLYRL